MADKSFSLDNRRSNIMQAFDSMFPYPAPQPQVEQENNRPWIVDTFDDYLIVCDKGTNYKVSYSLNGEKVELAPRSEWKEAYPKSPEWVSVKAATVKAIGDWLLDVLAIPFNKKDSDKQTFDSQTDFMLEAFTSPAIIYHHGVEPGIKGLAKSPVVVGKATNVEMRSDGIHVMVLLDKTLDYAKRIWEAAKNGLAVASSDSISHLARLDVGGGKIIMYEKNRAGRIAVWPLAGLSLWDAVVGNFKPASNYAIAMPVMKSIYREAGLNFPDIVSAGDSEADKANRARIVQIQKEAKKYLSSTKEK